MVELGHCALFLALAAAAWAMALAAPRDPEDDRATGKIGDTHHAELKTALSTLGVSILKRIDELERSPGHPSRV